MSHLFVLVCRHELHSKWTGLLKSAKSYSRKGRADLCLLLNTCLFFGREFLPWNNCVQNTSYEETDKLFRYKHGHVRLVVFNFPVSTQNSTVIHGRVLACWWWLRSSVVKIFSFPIRHVHHCFRSEFGSDSSGSIWRCVLSPSFSTHHAKTVSLLHSRHMGYCNGLSLTIFICPQTGRITRIPREANLENALERDFWRLFIACKLLPGRIHCIHLPANRLAGNRLWQRQ